MGRKIANPPFGRIEIPLKESGGSFRFIGGQEAPILGAKLKLLSKLLDDYNMDDMDVDNIIPKASPISAFANEYEAFLHPRDEGAGWRSWMLKSPFYAISELTENFQELDLETYHTGDQYADQVSINSEGAEALYLNLERLKGILDDNSELKRKYQENQGQGRKELFEELGLFLRGHLDLGEISQRFAQSNSFDEAQSILETSDFSIEQRDRERELSKKVRELPVEEKRRLSGELKDLQEQIKKRRQIQLGMIDLFSLKGFVDIYKNKIKEIQEFLIARKSSREESRTYTFDAVWDEDLDKDPGHVSGDCTEGQPLPFKEADIPVHNVKVFSPSQEHIGNMYLLVTESVDGKGPVWHFDAIQVPSRINWGAEVENIIERFSQEAKKKGVYAITVNSGSAISNYDYIQKAVTEYWQTKTSKEYIAIKVPPNPDRQKYTDFQSTYDQLVLWKNEES